MSDEYLGTGENRVRPPMFYPGVLEADGDGVRLLGAKCRGCGRVFYPRVAVCLDCMAGELEDLRLSREGLLECFTTVQMPAARIAAPYTVGYVMLPERLRVFAPIRPDGQSLRVGMPMRLAEFRLGRGEDETLAYCFVPA